MPLWLFWIVFGLIAGTLAKFLIPGRDPAGCIFTIALGVIGEYLGRLYVESKQRPLYLVDEYHPPHGGD